MPTSTSIVNHMKHLTGNQSVVDYLITEVVTGVMICCMDGNIQVNTDE